MTLLEVKGLTKHFGALVAISDLDFVVEEGMILGIIGPNGSGKTTLYNLITGFLRPTRGKVIFKGQDITHLSPYSIAGKGIARTFQIRSLFGDMTVLENMLTAHHLRYSSGDWSHFLYTPSSRKDNREAIELATQILDYVGLGDKKDMLANNLPHGHQSILELALALAAGPKLLLLDEPVAGMNETETITMTNLIKKIRDDMKITIAVVEHDMRAVMSLSEHIIVLNFGRRVAEGTPNEVVNNKDVIEAYLGTEEEV